jgi:uncharacterized membrane protein
MKNRIVFSFMLITSLLILSSMVSAAIITGSIYDLALQKESDVVIGIDTVPNQLLVSKEGDYTFNVKPGSYTIYAHTLTSQASESILVTDDGEYTFDIILEDIPIGLPLTDLSENLGLDVSFSDPSSKDSGLGWSIAIIVAIILFVAFIALYSFYRYRKHKNKMPELSDFKNKSVDEHEKLVLSILKKEKRLTQKDLRKHIPLSEAKVSLIISDLEDKGKIRKIKKGRGNVLIFVKE